MKTVMRVYNVIQILVCGYMTIGFMMHMYGNMPLFHTISIFKSVDVTFFNLFAIDTKYNSHIEWLLLVSSICMTCNIALIHYIQLLTSLLNLHLCLLYIGALFK